MDILSKASDFELTDDKREELVETLEKIGCCEFKYVSELLLSNGRDLGHLSKEKGVALPCSIFNNLLHGEENFNYFMYSVIAYDKKYRAQGGLLIQDWIKTNKDVIENNGINK